MSQAAYLPGGTAPGDRGEIDLAALFREVARAKWMILLVTIGVAVLATAAVSVLKPRFTAETRILVENRDTEYTRFGRDGGRASDPLIDQEQVASQVQIITSRDLARRMIERFDLGSKREFDPVIDGIGLPARIGVMLGLIDNPANVSPQDRILDSYYDKLRAFPMTRSRVLAIEFQSRDPELAARIANALAEEYIRDLESAKKGTAQSAGGWLQRTIEPLRQRVAEAEARVEAFRNQNGLFRSDENTNISTQQLSELNSQLATARAQQADLTAKARIIREAIRQGRVFEVSDVANNEVVRRLIERRAELKAQIAQEGRTLLPQHPRIRELEAQLGGLEEQVRAAAERAARALENDARAAGARVAASQAELDQQKRQTGAASEAEVQLRVLEREAKAEREQLENYLARFRDASVRNIENAAAADARVISRATVPSSPTFPKRLPIIIIATLSAFTLSLFLVLTRALLSDRIYIARAPAVDPAASMAPFAGAYAVPPQMLQSFYAQHAAMMAAQATQQAQPTPTDAPPSPQASGVRRPANAMPASSAQAAPPAAPAADPLRESLDRMRESLRIQKAHAGKDAAAPTPPAATAPTARQAPAAPAVATPEASAASPPARPMQQPATPVVVADAPPTAVEELPPYDQFEQVADSAQDALSKGRPVGVLILSALDASFAASAARQLARRLERRGSVASTVLESARRSPGGVVATIQGFEKQADYVVINGGNADAQSAGLAEAANLTVLVASEDILDARTEVAERNLRGAAYFIVGAPAPEYRKV